MNEKILETLKKIALNESLQKEFLSSSDQNADKLFELCQKNSDENFTREEFELILAEVFISFFESLGTLSNVSKSDMANVAGGLNLKKFGSVSLASLALMGPLQHFTPKVSAWDLPPICKTVKDKFVKMPASDKIAVISIVLMLIPGIYKLAKWLGGTLGKDVSSGVNWFRNTFIYNRLKLEKDPVKFRELAETFLKENIFAQDKAIEKIINSMSGHIDMWGESDRTGIPCTSACTMTFIGDSGTGKTYTARLLSRTLFGQDMQPWQFVTATSIKAPPAPSNAPQVNVSFNSFTQKQDETNKKSEEISPADQLFNENSEMIRQLRNNNRVVIVLDEIDKIHKNDPNDTILERLRDAKDTGKLRVSLSKGGHVDIDVSRTVFACISNEFRECWGLPKKELTPAEAAARTTVERDKSLVNRFDVIEFENFKKDNYVVILNPLIMQLQKSYLQTYNMNIEFSKDFAELVGQAAEEKNKGVRGLNDFIIELRGQLVNCRSKNKISQNNSPKDAKEKPVWKTFVKYDKTNGVFDVKAEKTEA